MKERPTCLSKCATTTWDMIVVGAGPAGALAAYHLASKGLRILLVDAKRFPRQKVCGGCLNRRGVDVLHRAGLDRVLVGSGARTINSMRLISGRQRARVSIPGTVVVDRRTFDALLVHEAVSAGAAFLDGTQCTVAPHFAQDCRRVFASRHDEQTMLIARTVVCADGLSRSSVKHLSEFRSVVSPGSRIGVCTTLPWQASLPPGEITMVVGRGAYVGLAPNPAGELNVAAAVDPSVLRGLPIAGVIRGILHEVGVLESVSLDDTEWHGTPALTSHPGLVAGERLFVVGDASGYVEPFSGEGMATALVTAAAVAPLVVEAIRDWQPALIDKWQSIHRQLVTNQQTTLRILTWLLRKPRVAAAAVGVCRLQPWIAKRVAAKVSA